MFLRGGMWWHWIKAPSGAQRRCSLETSNKETAEKVIQWADNLLDRLDVNGILAAVVRKEITIVEAYVLGEQGAVQYLADLRTKAADLEITDEVLDRWRKFVTQEQGNIQRVADNYVTQVKTAWVGPRMVSWLTPRNIIDALDKLDVQPATKGRYRTGFASLCNWLVRRGYLENNPMPSVPGYMQSKARELYYDREEALKVLVAVPEPFRSMEAVMWACGWEFSACANATVADFELDKLMAFARGTKNDHRSRWTVITEPVVIPMIKAALKDKLPTALVWPGITADQAVKVHQKACKSASVTVTTNHDWRHTFAVKELKKGRSPQFVAQQLGHANTQLVNTRYGKHVLRSKELEVIAEQIRAEAVGM